MLMSMEALRKLPSEPRKESLIRLDRGSLLRFLRPGVVSGAPPASKGALALPLCLTLRHVLICQTVYANR